MAKIENDIERDLYIDKIARKYDIGTGPIIKEVEKRLKKASNDEIVIDMQSINRKMQLVTNIRKRQEQYIIALILCKDKKIQEEIFDKIKPEDIHDENVRNIYNFLIDLKNNFDINKIDILSKVRDEEMVKELTEIMYIDLSMSDRNKLFHDVIKNKNKEKLFLRRDEILKRISENITSDEKEILNFELNQIVVELSKLK